MKDFDPNSSMMERFRQWRAAEKRDIEKGYYTYGPDKVEKFTLPETFMMRMNDKYGVNPFEETYPLSP